MAVTGATILTGNLTANGTTASFPTANPTVKAKSAAAVLSYTTQLATEAQVALKANINNPAFTGMVTVAPKSTPAGNDPTYVATEAQVYAVAHADNPALNAFRDSFYLKGQNIAGVKNFTNAPLVPNKSAAITALTGDQAIATEAQVYATVMGSASNSLKAFRDSVYTTNMILGGDKTFTGTVTMPVPQLPTSTAAKTFFAAPTANNGIPSFRQIVYADLPPIERANKLAGGGTDSLTLANLNAFKTTTESGAQTLGSVKTFSSAPVVPQKSTAITASNATTAIAVATEA
ncbi:hypothetical protein AGMMS49525_10740 [Bacteroidia bacterium]|nr:hypothetical protein AGMMS49525_10740 [Bacteroidia bacterium]